MTTVSIHMPENTGLTGFTLFLRKTSDRTLLNTGGDPLTESPSGSKWFIATVGEEWTETLSADVVMDSSGLSVREGWLAVGETIVVDCYPNQKLTEIHDAIYPPTPADEPLVIVPSEPDTVTGWAVCIGLDGQAAAGIVVTYKLQSPPPRDTGRIFNGSTNGTETSAANGLIQFEGLVPGATYYFTCGASQVSVTIPLDADPVAGYQLPSFTKT